jgi:hypothetical protein
VSGRRRNNPSCASPIKRHSWAWRSPGEMD